MTQTPRRPPSLPASAAPLWKRACRHLIEAGSTPTEAQLPLIESYCLATLRIERLRALESSIDPLEKDGRDVLKMIQSAELHQKNLAVELKISPRSVAAQASGPKGGRPPGTGTSTLRKKPEQAGAEVHWLEKARGGHAS